jgi:hypothetical protein
MPRGLANGVTARLNYPDYRCRWQFPRIARVSHAGYPMLDIRYGISQMGFPYAIPLIE